MPKGKLYCYDDIQRIFTQNNCVRHMQSLVDHRTGAKTGRIDEVMRGRFDLLG